MLLGRTSDWFPALRPFVAVVGSARCGGDPRPPAPALRAEAGRRPRRGARPRRRPRRAAVLDGGHRGHPAQRAPSPRSPRRRPAVGAAPVVGFPGGGRVAGGGGFPAGLRRRWLPRRRLPRWRRSPAGHRRHRRGRLPRRRAGHRAGTASAVPGGFRRALRWRPAAGRRVLERQPVQPRADQAARRPTPAGTPGSRRR